MRRTKIAIAIAILAMVTTTAYAQSIETVLVQSNGYCTGNRFFRYVITAEHCIQEENNEPVWIYNEFRNYKPANVYWMGSSRDSTLDLAVLTLDADYGWPQEKLCYNPRAQHGTVKVMTSDFRQITHKYVRKGDVYLPEHGHSTVWIGMIEPGYSGSFIYDDNNCVAGMVVAMLSEAGKSAEWGIGMVVSVPASRLKYWLDQAIPVVLPASSSPDIFEKYLLKPIILLGAAWFVIGVQAVISFAVELAKKVRRHF